MSRGKTNPPLFRPNPPAIPLGGPYVLESMALQASQTGRPEEGLTLIEHALVRADRLTPTELAIAHTYRARALAKMARVPETLAAIGTADDHFAHTDPANVPPFVAHHNAALYAGITGGALADLAMRGHDPAPAVDRLTTAITGILSGYVRFRVMCQIKLASLTMVTGDPVEAATLGTAALEAASAIRSHQAIDELRQLARSPGRLRAASEPSERRVLTVVQQHRNVKKRNGLRHGTGPSHYPQQSKTRPRSGVMTSVLIIGAGIAGTALALALHRASIEATVYEAHPRDSHDAGAFLTLASNGMLALRQIGADTVVANAGSPLRTMRVRDGAGHEIATVALGDHSQSAACYHYLTRASLCRALQREAQHRGIRIHLGKRLTHIADHLGGVTAHFSDNSHTRGDLLIGCDGVSSTVRSLIDPTTPPRATWASASSTATPATPSRGHGRRQTPKHPVRPTGSKSSAARRHSATSSHNATTPGGSPVSPPMSSPATTSQPAQHRNGKPCSRPCWETSNQRAASCTPPTRYWSRTPTTYPRSPGGTRIAS
jgi:hypothetical protein